jgi:hypothetical protein
MVARLSLLAFGLLTAQGAAGGCSRSALSQRDAAQDHSADTQAVDASDVLPTSCDGSVSLTGTSPEGAFSAVFVNMTVSTATLQCQPGVHFIVSDNNGAQLLFVVPPGPSDPSAIPLGKQTISVLFAGTSNAPVTTTATVDVTAADPPPFALCDQSAGLWPNTGRIALQVTLSQDGFAIAGNVSAPYCACLACDH